MKSVTFGDLPQDFICDRLLRLPTALWDCYREVLKINGICFERPNHNSTAIGGAAPGASLSQFDNMFANACARLHYCLSGVETKSAWLSSSFANRFQTGSVAILDIPSGAAATSAAFISFLMLLRAAGILPILPLNVDIVLADYSSQALGLAQQILNELSQPALRYGIKICHSTVRWDAFDNQSTFTLAGHAKAQFQSTAFCFIIVSNFSAVLGKNASKRDVFAGNLNTLRSAFETCNQQFIWVEPKGRNQKKSQNGILCLLGKLIGRNSDHGCDEFDAFDFMFVDDRKPGKVECDVAVSKENDPNG